MGTADQATDLTGIRFGFLTVTGRAGTTLTGKQRSTWFCTCDCGQKIIVRRDRLLAGKKKACNINGHFPGHFQSHDYRVKEIPEYRVWCAIRERCGSPRYHKWENYGGRGIKVCARWQASFYAFLSDMGPRPPGGTIERKNVNGDYEPGNCRWASTREQNRNKRTSKYVEWEGKQLLLIELTEGLGLNYQRVAGRLKMGWPLPRALFYPVRPKRGKGTLPTAT
jgi:hypothetical protein